MTKIFPMESKATLQTLNSCPAYHSYSIKKKWRWIEREGGGDLWGEERCGKRGGGSSDDGLGRVGGSPKVLLLAVRLTWHLGSFLHTRQELFEKQKRRNKQGEVTDDPTAKHGEEWIREIRTHVFRMTGRS